MDGGDQAAPTGTTTDGATHEGFDDAGDGAFDAVWDEQEVWSEEPAWVDEQPNARFAAPTQRTTYRVTRRGKVVFTVVPLLILGGLGLTMSGDAEALAIEGITDGTVLNAEQSADLTVAVTLAEPAEADSVTAVLGDLDVPVTLSPDGLSAQVELGSVPEGEHELTVSLDGGILGGGSLTRLFSVDATAPVVELLGPTEPSRVSQPVTLQIGVDDPQSTITVDGTAVEVVDGVVRLDYERPPRAPVTVTATDPAGNVTAEPMSIPVALPGEPGQDPIRGVHASGWTWATPELKDPIMQMVEDGLINTVQIDLKDEAGDIWYDTSVELAHEIGAVTVLWDLEQVIQELHAQDVRVVARIVNFRDPRLAEHAVASGNTDWIVQNPDGTPYGKYGGFANPFSPDVWEYNIALAEEAARLGVDDVLYDYVRRPDDYIENMRFPLQEGTPEQAIIDFLELSKERVHAAGARLGASVFGIAATRPDEVAQDIPAMAPHVDYIAPMVYPSHWGPGEYGVADPNSQPYDIVYASMKDFVSQLEGTGAGLISWLQDFSLGVDYGEAEVRAQIDASADAGVPGFLLWDAATTYTRSALE